MNASLPSQAKAGPRCPKCGNPTLFVQHDGEYSDEEMFQVNCRTEGCVFVFISETGRLDDFAQFFQLPAPAALSVEEYAAQFKWAVARFSENVGAAEWLTKTQALEFARHFAGAVGQPPLLCEKCSQPIGPLCQHVVWFDEDGTRHHRHASDCTAPILNQSSLPGVSPDSSRCQCGDGGCIKCWPSNFTKESLIEELASTRNSHEELKRELEQWTKWGVVEVAVRNPQVADYCNHWEGRAESAEKSASDKEQEIAMLTKDFGELARKAETSERLNAELREALRAYGELSSLIGDQTSRPSWFSDDAAWQTYVNADEARIAVLSKAEKAVRP